MEIDERLFEAFSPTQLKDALNEAAEIELPPIRSTWGGPALAPMWKILASNLLGPITKLGTALVMVFIFTAVTVAPQAQLAREAGIVLCGMRRRARCVRLLHRTRAASSQPPTARFAGGSISWAYGMDHLGKPWWVDLSKEVGAWAKAAEKEAPPEIKWELPVDAKVRSFNEKFVDAMLGLGAGIGSPADELLHLSRPSPSKEIADAFGNFAGASPTALRTLASESGCSYYGGNRSFPIPAKSVSSVDFWPTCLLPATFETPDGMRARLGSTLSELVAVWPKLVRDGGDQADTRFRDLNPKPCATISPAPKVRCPDGFERPVYVGSPTFGPYAGSMLLSVADAGAYMARLTEALPSPRQRAKTTARSNVHCARPAPASRPFAATSSLFATMPATPASWRVPCAARRAAATTLKPRCSSLMRAEAAKNSAVLIDWKD